MISFDKIVVLLPTAVVVKWFSCNHFPRPLNVLRIVRRSVIQYSVWFFILFVVRSVQKLAVMYMFKMCID